jgi:hypothetical protein
MKKTYSILLILLITTFVCAQSPQKMSYQSVIRNSSNQLTTNKTVRMRISVLQGTVGGNAVYTETQTPTTNANGLVSIEIGGGAGFATIDWSTGPYFIMTETDPTGGSNFTITGTSQLLSVPYALHAKTAETLIGGGTETDPVWTAASGNYYTKNNMQSNGTSALHFNNLTNKPTTVAGYGILDAMTTAHPANAITALNIGNWNMAFGWGNHALAGYQPLIINGNSDQYYRGDKSWQTLFAGIGSNYGTAATAARSDHYHGTEYIQNETASVQSAGFNISGSGNYTGSAANSNATGIGLIGIGNNTTYTNFPAYNGGGAFLGTAIGVFGQASNASGERAGGFFRTDGSAYARVGGYNSASAAKLIWGVGTMSSAIQSQDGLMADLSATLNPETIITDYGIGKLENGKCRIEIDPLVTKRIYVSNEYPIKVFIQLEGDCSGVFVTNKSANGFDVVELMGGKSDVPFSWTITANLNDIFSPNGSVASKNLGSRAKEYNDAANK